MSVSAAVVLRGLRIAVLGCLPLFAGCAQFAQSSKSPPRVDVPEPGAARTAPGTRAASATPGTVASRPSYPAPARAYPGVAAGTPAPSALPLPAPGGAVGEDSFTIESADGSATPGQGAAGGGMEPMPASAPPAQSGNSAVNTLLAQAATERRGGNLDAAIAAAERALRIAPADPAVYCELATLRLERGDLALAEQLARKGLSYGPNPELQQRLGAIVERARRGATG